MRIGVVTTSYPRWLGDHAGAFVEGHVRALRMLGHEVEIIAARDTETPRNIAAEQQEVKWRSELAEATKREREGRRATETGPSWRVDLRERERREDERRALEDDAHEIDLRERERRERERRTDIGGEPRVPKVVVVRDTMSVGGRVVYDHDHRAIWVRSHGLFYRGGAPEAFERAPWRSALSAAAFMPELVAKIATHARKWDHIIAHWLVPSALAARIARKPITAIAHGGDIYTLRRFGLLKPTLRALRGAKLVFVSEELRQIAGVDGIVQPMGVDLEHFASIGRAPATPPIVLFVGRLVPIKGVDTLIEAMAHLPPDWRLVIAGDGPERKALEARARHTRVTFLGAVSTGHRDRLLREASVVAVPSRTIAGRTEGCPTIALEALASGVPVVATVGRACEIIRSDDPVGLARGIERASGRTNTAAFVRDLDWMTVAERLLRSE